MSEKQAECQECHCRTGGGDYCYQHAPYMVWPKADGSFIVDRNGRKRVWLDEPPSEASEAGDSMASAEYSNKAGRGAAKTTSNSLAPIESPASFVTIRAQQMLESAADEFRQRASIESPASPVPRPYWEEEEAANTFLRAYAQRSKMTPQRLLSLGSYPMRCECGDTMCEGWKMVSIRIDPDPPTGDPQ